jgi:ribosomal protein S18 acetylase RimI-like enzyme
MPIDPTARHASTADVPGMAEALALAFQDDPVMAWLFGDDQDRTVGALRKFFAHEGRRHLRNPTVFTTDAHDGASYWDPPGQWKTPVVRLLGMAPFMVGAMRHRIVRAMRGLSLIEQVHGEQPQDHYYLSMLGTRPDRQGNGIGAALMAPILRRCDEDGIGAYLESSKEANIPFYRRHGFEVVTELQLPKGPGIWPMWRDPQPPAQG